MPKKSQWKVYIIQTQLGKLYTGITTNLERRFEDHLKQKKGARFFRFSDPKHIVFFETFPNRGEATRREIQIKKMSRKQKLVLIEAKST